MTMRWRRSPIRPSQPVAKLVESEKRGLASKFRALNPVKPQTVPSRNFVACTRFSSPLTSTTGC